MHGWKLDHENFIRENNIIICFWAEFGKTTKYLILEKFRLYSMYIVSNQGLISTVRGIYL